MPNGSGLRSTVSARSSVPTPVLRTAFGFVRTAGSYASVAVPGAGSTNAEGLNNEGQVTGYYSTSLPGDQGFVETAGSYATFSVPGAVYTFAEGINDAGQVVGSYNNTGSTGPGSHGFLDIGGTFATIDVPGASYTVARGINNVGQVTGYFGDSTGIHAFVETMGSFATFGQAGSGDTEASGINDAGQVTGTYYTTGPHGFLATPTALSVPEPASVFLLGLEVALLAVNGKCRLRH